MKLLDGSVFQLNASFHLDRQGLLEVPEVLLGAVHKKDTTTFTVKNFSVQANAYQLEAYFYEDGLMDETITPVEIGTERGILLSGGSYIFDSSMVFEGCFSVQQYWLEYENKYGQKFRSILEFSSSGKVTTYPPLRIRSRTRSLIKITRPKRGWHRIVYLFRYPRRSLSTWERYFRRKPAWSLMSLYIFR